MLLLKIKYRLGLLYKTVMFKMGLGHFLLKNRYGECIIVFHGIADSEETKYNSRFVSKAYFEELMDYFSKNYNILSLEDFYAGKFKKDKLNIALTFDDGLLNNYNLALPILEKYKIPATFFITTIHDIKNFLWPDFLDLVCRHTSKKEIVFEGNLYKKNHTHEFTHRGTTLKQRCKFLEYDQIEPVFSLFEEEWKEIIALNLDTYWKLLDHGQLKKIAQNPLFTIGGHGITHSNLASIASENAKTEIHLNKKLLEEITGEEINSFAFPFGNYDSDLIKYCEQAGYSKILVLDYQSKNDHLSANLKNRFVVNPYISKEHFLACLLKGSYM